MSFRCLATGDWHLGQGVQTYGPDRLDDQERVGIQIMELANREKVDCLLLAGDIFETRRPTVAELVAFSNILGELDPGIPIVAIPGNGRHDGNFPGQPLALELFPRINFLARGPILFQVAGVSIACLPWVDLGRLVASSGREDLNQRAAELLIGTARGLREQIDGPAVLLAHWSVSDAWLPTGLPTDQLREVVLPVSELVALDFDAVVLGHIHRAQVIYRLPEIFYVGSPMPLNHGETEPPNVEPGSWHGVTILEITLGQPTYIERRFIPLDSRRFVTVDADLTVLDNGADVTGVLVGHAGTHELADAIVKIRYRCTEEQARRLDIPRVKAALLEAGVWHVSFEPRIERTDRARVEIDEGLTPLEALFEYTKVSGIDPEMRKALGARMAKLLQEVDA